MFYFRCIFYTFYTNTGKMTINEFIEKYNSDNFDSYIKENASIDYWNELIKTYKIEKLNFVFPEAIHLTVNHELKEGKNLLGIDFNGFCERQIKKLEIEKQYKPQQTVFDLTIENLLKSGCNEQEANELFNTTGDYNLQSNNGKFYVSKLEKKFYIGIDYHRKVNFNNSSLSFPVNCPDLIPEYYNLSLYNFLEKQKKSLGLLYNEVNQTEKFISNEINRSKDIIENAKESFIKRTQHKFESKELLVNVYESYIYFLEALEPKQPETNNTDEVKNSHPKHNPNDWNTDCFELFKYLIDNFYKDSKRTNTKLICIWFYLSEYNPEKYILKFTKDNYKIFIKDNYGITITNTDKPDNYQSKVLSTLHEHRKIFEDSLK